MPDDDDDNRDATNLIVAGAVILLVVLGTWLLLALRHSDIVMECLARHLSNCVPLDNGQ